MFTLEQIKAAHSKVRSGTDFPAYIHDLKAMGVTGYTTHVADGHTQFFGSDGFTISSDARYAPQNIAGTVDPSAFQQHLKEHQQAKTDYNTFCEQCAVTGVAQWQVAMAAMTCTYYAKDGGQVLMEEIPVV